MNSYSPSLTACLVLVASCAAWIHGIIFVVFEVFDPDPVTGWVVVGLLAFAMTSGLTILLYEMQHVANLNEDVVDPEEFDGLVLPLKWTARGGFWTKARSC